MKKIKFVNGKLGAGFVWVECGSCRYWGDSWTEENARFARCNNPSSDYYDMSQFPSDGCYEGED